MFFGWQKEPVVKRDDFMNDDTDKILDEMIQNMILADKLLRERFGDFDIKDILLNNSMKTVPSGSVFPMDFKYERKV